MSLIDFYNNVFLVEVKEMIKHTNKNTFICTPIREQQIRKVKGSAKFPPLFDDSKFNKPILNGDGYDKQYKI